MRLFYVHGLIGLILVVGALGVLSTSASDQQQPTEIGRLFEQSLRLAETGLAEEAETLALEALARARASDDLSSEAEISYHLGGLYRKALQAPMRALEHYDAADRLFAAIGDDASRTGPLNNRGRVLLDLGELDAAVATWNEAVEIARRVGKRSSEVAALGNLTLALRRQGRPHEALARYDQLLEIEADPSRRCRLLNNRGRVYRVLGDDRQALSDLRRALKIAEREDDDSMRATSLTGIGQLHEHRGELDAARDALEDALALRSRDGAKRGMAVTLASLAATYESLNELVRAREANQRALALFEQVRAPRGAATARAALGRLAAADGRFDEADLLFHQALSAFRALRDPYGEIRALLSRGATARAVGRLDDALDAVSTAATRIESLRRNARGSWSRAAFVASQQDRIDFHVDLLMEMHGAEPSSGHARRALEVHERSRARALADSIAVPADVIERLADPVLVNRQRQLSETLDVLEAERFRLVDRPGSASRDALLATLDAKIDSAVRAYRATRASMRAAAPAHLRDPEPLDAERITKLVDGDTLLLIYRLGPKRSHLWAVGTDAVTSYALAARSVLEAAARDAHALLAGSPRRSRRAVADRALDDLARHLLAPVADRLATHTQLAVIADGALHYVPFAALPRPGRGEPLVATHAVVGLPSASVLALLRARDTPTPRDGTVAVIADPVFDGRDPRAPTGAWRASAPDALPRLLHTRDEADAIVGLAGPDQSRLALGFDATLAAATDPALGRYRFVHFATHGVIDGERPELSRLVFSRVDDHGRQIDGLLYVHDLHSLQLPVEMVALSACETALGPELRGEGWIGSTQGFLQAGARRVLVSLWRVDDRATGELMKRLYAAMLEDGKPPAAALRLAQDSLRRETGWRAPYFWAGFVLQGDWRPVSATHR